MHSGEKPDCSIFVKIHIPKTSRDKDKDTCSILRIWIIAGHGPTVLLVGVGRGCLDVFSLFSHFSFSSLRRKSNRD